MLKAKLLKIVSFLMILTTLDCYISSKAEEILKVGAIPDQNPEKLNRLYKLLTNELSKELKISVKYIPVTNYAAAVTAFRTKNLDLVWFGGLTGVQARLQSPGSIVIAQRDIDKNFKSVFIANTNVQIKEIKSIKDLRFLRNKRFTYGSENSTSGRLMPQYFLKQAGIKNSDFKGKRVGFSGSHDSTIALVQSGSYDVGALNLQIWKQNIKSGKVDSKKVIQIWISPSYQDYHWLAQADLDNRFGKGFTKKLQKTFINLNRNSSNQAKILDLFGANRFIKANSKDYKKIEKIGREVGKIR